MLPYVAAAKYNALDKLYVRVLARNVTMQVVERVNGDIFSSSPSPNRGYAHSISSSRCIKVHRVISHA